MELLDKNFKLLNKDTQLQNIMKENNELINKLKDEH